MRGYGIRKKEEERGKMGVRRKNTNRLPSLPST